jgi:MoaA/NifB/PqqE/SkfB family radical SAM enzyme
MNKVFTIKQENLFAKKQLTNLYCPDPFETVHIDQSGNVGLCGCQSWHPHKIGNIFQKPLVEIFNNQLATQIRQSIRDGSYVYCNEQTCGSIINNTLIPLEQLEPNLQQSFSAGTFFEMPYTFYIAGDDTCNLSCPSCRTKIVDRNEHNLKRNSKILNILNEQVFNGSCDRTVVIKMSTSGEVFASALLMEFCSRFNLNNYPKAEFWFQSNGLLVSSRWHKIQHIANHIQDFTITADSSVKHTYEKLRRGGKYEKLLENLLFLKRMKSQYHFGLTLRMVVQKDNCNELTQFYNFAKSYDADLVEYVRITDWGTYPHDQFQDLDVLNSKHQLFDTVSAELQQLHQQPDVKIYGVNI